MTEEGKKMLESCRYHLWELDTADLARYVDLTEDWTEVWEYGPQWSPAAQKRWTIDIIRLGIRGEIAEMPGTPDDYTNDGNDYDVYDTGSTTRITTLHSLYDCAQAIESDQSISIWWDNDQLY